MAKFVDQVVKQRLIGAVVLIALAVLFLPSMLGKKKERKVFESKIPKEISVKFQTLDHQTSKDTQNRENDKNTSSKQDQMTSDNTMTLKKETESSQEKSIPIKEIISKEQISTTKQKKNQVSEKPKPVLEAVKKSGWVIQVGSFSSKENAENLAKKLETKQFKTFVRHKDVTKNQMHYRVFVGPWLNEKQAKQHLKEIKQFTGLTPLLTKWRPDIH